MNLFEEIFDNNRAWVTEKLKLDANYFQDLSKGQTPDILYIGCSDSRVTAEEMTGVSPGQMFVHRNVANVIPNNDLNSSAVIEYAVKYLKVKQIMVCGHYYCGGVKAAMESADLGILNPWLRNIRDVYRLHKEELNAIKDEQKKYNRLVELNVQEQCLNVIKMAVWQKQYLSEGYPEVHGCVFDVSTGELIDLNIDFQKSLKSIQEIYNLTNG